MVGLKLTSADALDDLIFGRAAGAKKNRSFDAISKRKTVVLQRKTRFFRACGGLNTQFLIVDSAAGEIFRILPCKTAFSLLKQYIFGTSGEPKIMNRIERYETYVTSKIISKISDPSRGGGQNGRGGVKMVGFH